ncbi:unnamed protein product, partial [Allacma fusca]
MIEAKFVCGEKVVELVSIRGEQCDVVFVTTGNVKVKKR